MYPISGIAEGSFWFCNSEFQRKIRTLIISTDVPGKKCHKRNLLRYASGLRHWLIRVCLRTITRAGLPRLIVCERPRQPARVMLDETVIMPSPKLSLYCPMVENHLHRRYRNQNANPMQCLVLALFSNPPCFWLSSFSFVEISILTLHVYMDSPCTHWRSRLPAPSCIEDPLREDPEHSIVDP